MFVFDLVQYFLSFVSRVKCHTDRFSCHELANTFV